MSRYNHAQSPKKVFTQLCKFNEQTQNPHVVIIELLLIGLKFLSFKEWLKQLIIKQNLINEN